jgi:hypothetical protein
MSPEKSQLQYLERYAEPEISVLTALDIGDYAHCLVIPAHRERPESIQQIWPHADPQLLMILVVNSWDADDDISQQMLQKLTREAGQQAGHLHYIRRTNRPDLLVVDRCHPGQLIPRPQGVGLARKIGADLALALICSGAVKSPLINSTDADVILPNNYFDLPTPKLSTAAILQPFRHYFDAELELASRLYDIAMYYYVRGLRFAGSGYAFHTIGSTLRINAKHYAQVRGFPKRNAAEDFYMLNKLAKTGQIKNHPGTAISIQARLSDRAPFGTGPALRAISSLGTPITEYGFYDPRVFDMLRIFLATADQLHNEDPETCFQAVPEILSWLKQSDLYQLLAKQRRSSNLVFQRFLRDWFDSFQTLKFIHFMRDQYLPSVAIDSICDGMVLPKAHIQNLESVRWLHRVLTEEPDPDL